MAAANSTINNKILTLIVLYVFVYMCFLCRSDTERVAPLHDTGGHDGHPVGDRLQRARQAAADGGAGVAGGRRACAEEPARLARRSVHTGGVHHGESAVRGAGEQLVAGGAAPRRAGVQRSQAGQARRLQLRRHRCDESHTQLRVYLDGWSLEGLRVKER